VGGYDEQAEFKGKKIAIRNFFHWITGETG